MKRNRVIDKGKETGRNNTMMNEEKGFKAQERKFIRESVKEEDEAIN